MSCSKCVNGKIMLFTSVVDCDCVNPKLNYPINVHLTNATIKINNKEELDRAIETNGPFHFLEFQWDPRSTDYEIKVSNGSTEFYFYGNDSVEKVRDYIC